MAEPLVPHALSFRFLVYVALTVIDKAGLGGVRREYVLPSCERL